MTDILLILAMILFFVINFFAWDRIGLLIDNLFKNRTGSDKKISK